MSNGRAAVLDTSVVVDFPTDDLLPRADTGLLSVTTPAESAYGLHTPNPWKTARRQGRYAWARSDFEILRYVEHCAHLHGAPADLLRKVGRDPNPRRTNLLIAAVAGVNQLPLITRNPKDVTGPENRCDDDRRPTAPRR